MRSLTSAIVLALGVVAGPLLAADHGVMGDRLRLRDPMDPADRRVQFRASRDPAIAPTLADDPRVVGATLEITGAGAGDGTTGVISLAPGFWIGLGRPAGAKGFRYVDLAATTGVRRILLKGGSLGGALTVNGRGANWPYAITQPQGPIDVRFTVGDEVYCTRFTTYKDNEAGKVVGENSPAPAGCGSGGGPVCGNSVVEGTEQCDDGNTLGDDGCSAACQLENPNCGDGAVDGVEECDDGNTTSGDGCSALCQLESAAFRCTGVPTVSGTGLDSVRIASGLAQPVFVTSPPLDTKRLFVVEQDGRIRIIKNGTLLPLAFLAIEGRVSCCGERGLLSVAFHPDYEQNGRFFVYYTDNGGDLVIARYQVTTSSPDLADAGSEQILLTIEHSSAGNHNGGQLMFGPDGYLYAATGDGGGGGDPFENGQNDGTLLGKMLRLDVDVEPFPYYAIPPTNPFAGAGDPLDEIWAKGLRNPWRFTFDRGTGDLYIADVGQSAREEVDVQPGASGGGENYGWDIFEGTTCFEPAPAPTCPSPPTGFTFPVLEYTHAQGCSITGGFVYRGCRMPDLHGTYFYSDFCTPFIKTFNGVVGGVAQNLADRTADLAPGGGLAINDIASYGEDARGELYIVDRTGEIFKIIPGS